MGVERAVAEDAAILSAIGIVTAFAVLLLMLVITLVARWVSLKVTVGAAEPTEGPGSPDPGDETQARDRALAAALAVTALLAARPASAGSEAEPG